MSAARFIVSGRVQGVGFRASARDQALALGLRGSARNLANGAVDVLAVGDDAAIDTLAAWLRQGPPLARVDELERLPAHDDDAPEGADSAFPDRGGAGREAPGHRVAVLHPARYTQRSLARP